MRHVTAIPISMGLPRQSLTFWRLLLSVIILRDIFLFAGSTSAPCCAFAAMLFTVVTSPLWLSFVFAAGLTATQKGFTK